MATLYSAVDCCEEHATLQEQLGLESGSASVVLRVPWTNRWLLVNDLLGNSRVWPYAPGLRATTCAIKPFDSKPTSFEGQTAVYEDALVTVSYSSKVEENLIAESIEPNVEFITLDHKRFRWGSDASGDPLSEAEAPGRQKHSLALTRTHYKLEPPLPASLLTLPGKCNDTAYASALLGLSFAKETLLFMPSSLSRTITTAGDRAFDLTLKYAYQPEGWNKYWRAKSKSYEEIYDVEEDEVYKGYPLASFSDFLV